MPLAILAPVNLQATATDRALGLRQTGGVADPGGAFVFQIANTTGKINFTLDFSLQSLDASSTRTTTWLVEYGLGSNPTSFTVPSYNWYNDNRRAGFHQQYGYR